MKKLYTLWIFILFAFSFFILFPLYYIYLQSKKWHHLAHNLTKYWAKTIMALAFIKVEIEFESELDINKAYIYTPNHFSYFDIPILAYAAPGFYKFIGKKSLGELPIFGYMFRNLYITVDRESKINSYKALLKGIETLNEGIGLAVFPEGGIVSKGPELAPFKDGPFKMGIEKQIPIVPVTIPFNWIFLPDSEKLRVHSRKLKIIFHKPIDTSSYNDSSLNDLKAKTFDIISNRLKKELESEN